jgi:shikimate 5-dehydrogenase
LLREVNGIARREGKLLGYARDPVAAGRTLAEMLDPTHFSSTGAEVLCLGAGGAGQAIILQLMTQEDRPQRIIVTDRSAERLESLAVLLRKIGSCVPVDRMHNAESDVHDALVGMMPPHSLVINATGMGKDVPGSPITDAARLPEDGIAWELNYRGDLDFLRQARAQQASRRLRVEDGWRQFIHGWTTVMEEVFQRRIAPDELDRLAEAAEFARPAHS